MALKPVQKFAVTTEGPLRARITGTDGKTYEMTLSVNITEILQDVEDSKTKAPEQPFEVRVQVTVNVRQGGSR